jgi:superfamily II DNA or RNA helicase
LVRTDVIHQPIALGSTIADQYPQLAFVLDDEQLSLHLIPCETIQVVTLTADGRRSEQTDVHLDREHHQILFRSDFADQQLLEFISMEFSLGLSRDEIEAIVESRLGVAKARQMAEIAKIADDAARLAKLVQPENLKAHLPQDLIDTVDEADLSDPVELARLALAVHGVTILKELRTDLVDSGWPAPPQWAGSQDARAFVAALGFDQAFAGFETRRLDALLTVDGPADLPAMHSFQSHISSRIEQLVETGKGRGLVSLPTGAGKTRVVVESLISSIKAGRLLGPILWVAQTEELCEQAIQTWAYIWRAIGAPHQIQLSRLWSGNEAEDSGPSIQVVVATIAKLDHLFEKDSYEWLSRATCVVIDEAHTSVTPQYTRLFNWQGMARGRDRVPVLGLTATPFRGTSEEETERLVSRYKRNRLDHGVFDGEDPYSFLQDQGVLAKVDHELLEGSEIHLTDEELGSLKDTRLLPATVGQRVGADAHRNRTLISSIEGLPGDWPILVFAASVDHAHTLAALLTRKGVNARSISAETERGARRYYVEAFRNGDIQVLTNFNVLSQGFDAPATRAVYIGRPTFSPNLYQQMIGRGLRGPENGGKETCLIVNVADNFANFGERLAFHEFEYLWKSTSS